MLIQCTSKGCYSQDHHLLDPDSNEVTCNTCGQIINIPQPMKKALQSVSQIRRVAKSGVQVKCKSCGHTGRPLLQSLSGGVTIATCRKCGKQLDVHPSFVLAMKEMGGEYAKDKVDPEHGDD